jgi:hypothetical protein
MNSYIKLIKFYYFPIGKILLDENFRKVYIGDIPYIVVIIV